MLVRITHRKHTRRPNTLRRRAHQSSRGFGRGHLMDAPSRVVRGELRSFRRLLAFAPHWLSGRSRASEVVVGSVMRGRSRAQTAWQSRAQRRAMRSRGTAAGLRKGGQAGSRLRRVQPGQCAAYRLEAGQAGGMFWFRRNTLSGSYLPFRARSRPYVAAGYAWPTRAAPSSIRKLTYTPV